MGSRNKRDRQTLRVMGAERWPTSTDSAHGRASTLDEDLYEDEPLYDDEVERPGASFEGRE